MAEEEKPVLLWESWQGRAWEAQLEVGAEGFTKDLDASGRVKIFVKDKKF